MFPPEYDDHAYMDEMDEFAQRYIREEMGTQAMMERADPFRDAHIAVTPERRSPVMDYMPGIGDPASPGLMGQHTRDFAMERDIPFEEQHRGLPELDRDEFMSTMPPGGPDGINYSDRLQGMYEDDYSRRPSLLTEPVTLNPNRFGEEHREGWPEGAIDYIGQNELENNWPRYSMIPGDRINDEYIRNKEADPGWSPPESAFWYDDLHPPM